MQIDAEAMPDKNLLFDTYKQKTQSQAPAQVSPGQDGQATVSTISRMPSEPRTHTSQCTSCQKALRSRA